MKRQAIVAQGTVEGLAAEDQGITVFRGVPFAQPPVGGLRWRAPQPALPWDGVLQAFDFGPTAMQPTPGASDDFYDREWGTDPAVPMSEDCLYLNIWTPALRGYGADSMVTSEKLPVMVWIYGGAYQCGGTFEKEFDGTHLAANGVVVVSVAYRLNAFGFMTHPLLHEEAVERGDGEPYANFGFLDQRAGIQWVKENIAKFGGDPENITVFGQSAGAASVLAQICSPMNHGLFQKAIMQSGAGLGYFNARQDTLEHAQANGIRLFEALGVSTLEQARAIPARTVLEAAESLPVPPDSGREDDWSMIVNWAPCVDGLFLPDQEERIVEGCKANNVDMLVGNTTNEFIASTEDGKPVHVGQLGNLTLIRKWTASGGTAPYYYHFDVAMPGDDAGAFVILLQKRGHYLSRVLAKRIHGVMLAAYNAAAAHEQGEYNVVLTVPRKREHVPLSAGLCHHCALLFAHALNRVRPVAELGGLFVFHIVAGLLHLRAEHIAHGGGVPLKEAHNAIEQLMVFLSRYVARTRRAAFV